MSTVIIFILFLFLFLFLFFFWVVRERKKRERGVCVCVCRCLCLLGEFMLRKQDLKYIAYVGYAPQLYNITADPLELNDLSKSKPDLIQEVQQTGGCRLYTCLAFLCCLLELRCSWMTSYGHSYLTTL